MRHTTRIVLKAHAAVRFALAVGGRVFKHADPEDGPMHLDPASDGDAETIDQILSEDMGLIASDGTETVASVLGVILRTRFDRPTVDRILAFVEDPTNETASAAVEFAEV